MAARSGKSARRWRVRSWGGVLVSGEVMNGVENGVVSLDDFRGIGRNQEVNIALGEGFEGGEGEFFVDGETRVDDIEKGDLGVEGPERLFCG